MKKLLFVFLFCSSFLFAQNFTQLYKNLENNGITGITFSGENDSLIISDSTEQISSGIYYRMSMIIDTIKIYLPNTKEIKYVRKSKILFSLDKKWIIDYFTSNSSRKITLLQELVTNNNLSQYKR